MANSLMAAAVLGGLAMISKSNSIDGAHDRHPELARRGFFRVQSSGPILHQLRSSSMSQHDVANHSAASAGLSVPSLVSARGVTSTTGSGSISLAPPDTSS